MKTYEDGIKEGRRQVIANLKKHYDDTYFEQPLNISGYETAISLPEATLYKYFKELTEIK